MLRAVCNGLLPVYIFTLANIKSYVKRQIHSQTQSTLICSINMSLSTHRHIYAYTLQLIWQYGLCLTDRHLRFYFAQLTITHLQLNWHAQCKWQFRIVGKIHIKTSNETIQTTKTNRSISKPHVLNTLLCIGIQTSIALTADMAMPA